MTGGRAPRQKGDRRERAVVQHWLDRGVHSERVPLSGASRNSYGGKDVDLYAFGRDEAPLVGEVKGRKGGTGFKTIARWLGPNNDFLVLHADHEPRLYVIPERVMERLIRT